MKRFLIFLFLSLAGCLSNADGAGHVGPSAVVQELRTWNLNIPYYQADHGNNTNDITAGRGGVVAVMTLASASDAAMTTTSSATAFNSFPYPCKVHVTAKDTTNDATGLACTSVTIRGRNQFGEPVSETITGPTARATATKSAKVYESLSSVTALNCLGNTSGSRLVVNCSNDYGLPARVYRHTDAGAPVISMCQKHSSDYYCYRAAQINYDFGVWAVRLDTVTGSPTFQSLSNGDETYLRVRWPAGL